MAQHSVPFLLARCGEVALAVALALVAAQAASAATPIATDDEPDNLPAAVAKRIYQQRLPDGRIVLTDRPQQQATTERTWIAPPEDVAAARARREEARVAAQAVNDRIERHIEAQRQRDAALDLERMRLSAAQAAAEAERARLEEAAQPVAIVIPGYRGYSRPQHLRHPRADRPGRPTPPSRPFNRPRPWSVDG